jgi:hypothetical protein
MLGIMFGEPLMRYVPDTLGLIVDTCLIIVCSIVLKIPEIEQTTIYVVFLM